MGTKSHAIGMMPLLEALGDKGHQVTLYVVSFDLSMRPFHARYNNKDVKKETTDSGGWLHIGGNTTTSGSPGYCRDRISECCIVVARS